jgi:hypothetical protein
MPLPGENGGVVMERKKPASKTVRYVCLGLPLAGAAASVFLPLQEYARQFMVLIVLLWFQFYLLFEIFLTPK